MTDPRRAGIHGVGVDLVTLARFERFAFDHGRSLPDLFRASERRRFRTPRALAGAWAVKEAALKAIGGLTGWDVNWREIEVGPGRVTLSGTVARHARRLAVGSLSSSTTAHGDAILATVIATRSAGSASPRRRGPG